MAVSRDSWTTNDANDVAPRYSPDGRYIAYLAMTRPGFEADRTQLLLHDRRTAETRSLTAELDRSVDFFAWSGDGGALLVPGPGAAPPHHVSGGP